MIKEIGNKSFKAEVRTIGEDTFHSNALRFKTKKEAEDYARDLSLRWTAVAEYRVVESEE